MKAKELSIILKKIKTDEALSVSDIARRVGLDRPNLSTIINKPGDNELSDNTVNKIKKVFPEYFGIIANSSKENDTNLAVSFSDQIQLLVDQQKKLMDYQELILDNNKSLAYRLLSLEKTVQNLMELNTDNNSKNTEIQMDTDKRLGRERLKGLGKSFSDKSSPSPQVSSAQKKGK
ncbi:hypothetical protein ACFS6H_19805 [Terrimonas rubra]|uniref:HTH cro/C1-type domain-containing protein n=1 Tax=Terrimonas rubra TaxID=1035890 RepID=A0ABW6A9F3_9BACT